jgi:6-pyruvoyl-tetrahydropterin synthase
MLPGMSTLFVNRLTVIDFSYLCPARGLVGESWQVDVELDGALDDQGMVLDFGDVKPTIKRLLDEEFDHRLLVPAGHPGLQTSDYPGGLFLSFTLDDGREIAHRSPRDAVCMVPCERLTPGRLAEIIVEHLQAATPANVFALRLRLWPETVDGAWYHYSHGLKHHAGNCQRIAHGHRSRLEIWRNGERDADLERRWADDWVDVYIGTRADLIGSSLRDGVDYHEFGYRSGQGDFGLTLPKNACYLIDTDSTVENIAQHIAGRLKANHPADRFRVVAYEGVDKGAIGEA